MPALAMDSRSFVIPSSDKFPSIKYQYTPGLAASGGFTNPNRSARMPDISALSEPAIFLLHP